MIKSPLKEGLSLCPIGVKRRWLCKGAPKPNDAVLHQNALKCSFLYISLGGGKIFGALGYVASYHTLIMVRSSNYSPGAGHGHVRRCLRKVWGTSSLRSNGWWMNLGSFTTKQGGSPKKIWWPPMRDPSGIKKKRADKIETNWKFRWTEDKKLFKSFWRGVGGGQAIIRAWMGNDQTPYKRLEKYSMSRTEH